MPIYEYECQNCGAHLEVMQRISEAPLTECRECGGRLEKQWSQTSFQLKGSGWYVSDYGKGGAKPADKANKSDSEAGDKKTEKSGDATDAKAKTGGDTAQKSEASKPSAPASKTD